MSVTEQWSSFRPDHREIARNERTIERANGAERSIVAAVNKRERRNLKRLKAHVGGGWR